MLRQLFVVIGMLANGSVLSYLALNSLPRNAGIAAGILVFGGVLLLLGFYVANNDRRRRVRDNYDLARRRMERRSSHAGRQPSAV